MNIRVLPALILYITAVYYIQLCSFWFIPCCSSSFISEEKNNDTARLVHGISSLCNTRKAIRQGHPVRAAIHHLLNQPTTHPSIHPNHTHTDTAIHYPSVVPSLQPHKKLCQFIIGRYRSISFGSFAYVAYAQLEHMH